MAILSVLQYPHPNLFIKATPVTEFNNEIRQLAFDMIETMYAGNGIGLAATQVNSQKRVIIVNNPAENNDYIFINPVILSATGDCESEEGCLSIPGINAVITRKEIIVIQYDDIDGVRHELSCNGIVAICTQHEIDHINGVLFIDHLSPLKQKMVKKKLNKQFARM